MENAVEEHNGAVACEGGRQQQQPLYVKTKTQNVYSYLINTRFVCVSSRMYLHGMLFLVYNSLIRHIIVHLFMHIQHTHAHIVHRTNITNAAQSSMWESFTLDFFHAFILCVGLLWYFTMLFVSFRSIPFVVSFCFWVNCHLHRRFWLQMCRHQQT